MNFNKKDSLANAVGLVLQQEALKGGQKKLDKNHNGKLDSQDFKILRGEKKVEEETDVNDMSVDDLGGQKKVKRKDDVGPGGDFKATKVRFHAGPKNESLEEPLEKVLADTAPHSGIIQTVMATDDLEDKNKSVENKTKLKMKEGTEQIDEKKWIAGAIKKPGAMTAAAKREGKSTSEYIKSHEHEGGKAGQRARLAKTLKGFKEQYSEYSIYDELINEVLSKDASAGDWIHDFVHSDNPKFAGKSKEMRKKMALAAYYAKQRKEEVELEEGLGDKLKEVGKKALEKLGHGSDEDMRKDLQKKAGLPQTGKKPTSEEVEQIDELKKSTLGSYVKGAARDMSASRKIATDFEHRAGRAKKSSMKDAAGRLSDKFNAIARKRNAGIGKAVERLTKEETVEEGWDDMVKSAKDAVKSGPKPSGGSGVKQGSRYGGGKQKDKPEHDDDKVKNEAKRPDTDTVPFVTDEAKPMTHAKYLAKKSMKRMRTEMLGKISN